MADQATVASKACSDSHFDFIKPKPRNDASGQLRAAASKCSASSATGLQLTTQPAVRTAAQSRPGAVRLPDAPALPIRKMPIPLPAVNNMRSARCPQPIVVHKDTPSTPHQQPLLPMHGCSSAGAGWKQVTRPTPSLTKRDDPPLLSRLAKLTSSTGSATAAAGNHVAGVLPAHPPQEQSHGHLSTAQQVAQPHQIYSRLPGVSASGVLPQQKAPAQASAPPAQSTPQPLSGSAQEVISHSKTDTHTTHPAGTDTGTYPGVDQPGAIAASESAEFAGNSGANSPEAHSPAPQAQSLSVPDKTSKSASRSRLRLQRPPPSARLTPTATQSPRPCALPTHMAAASAQQKLLAQPSAKSAAGLASDWGSASPSPEPPSQQVASSRSALGGSHVGRSGDTEAPSQVAARSALGGIPVGRFGDKEAGPRQAVQQVPGFAYFAISHAQFCVSLCHDCQVGCLMEGQMRVLIVQAFWLLH